VALTTAAIVALAAAVVLLWLGLVRLAYEVRQLRRLVLDKEPGVPEEALRLPAEEVRFLGRPVLAVSSSCDSCWVALAEARAHADATPGLVVLTYQDPEVFASAAGDLPVVRSRTAWRAVAHLSPPVLLRVEPDGRVAEVSLPAGAGDVTEALSRWGGQEVPS
jgi:hypothetical protein